MAGIIERKYSLKKCPRCGMKCVMTEPTCPDCGLVFAKLANCSNKMGKRKYVQRKKDEYLMSDLWTPDVKRWKAVVWCVFLGAFGAHNFYLGRYLKASFSLVFSLITLIFAGMTVYPSFYDTFIQFFAIPAAFPFIFWIFDFFSICLGKYKIPIAIDERLVTK